MGQDRTGPGPSARGRRRNPLSLHRGVRADHGCQLRAVPARGCDRVMTSFRYAVNVTPKPGILDPQGRAVEGSLGHLGVTGVSAVRVGRRVELTVEAPDASAARLVVDKLARELLSNPLIEAYDIDAIAGASSMTSTITTET